MSSETLLSKYGIEVMIVVDNKNDPTQTGCCKLYNPMKHGPNFTLDDLAFSTPISDSQYENARPPDNGSVMYVMRPEGAPNGIILGKANEKILPAFSGKEGDTGGRDLLSSSSLFTTAYKDKRINLPPDIKETSVNDVIIRELNNKSDLYSHSSREGLPSSGAPSVKMCGAILPQVKGIATALQSFNDIIPASIFAQLPGLSMSLGVLLRKLVENNLLKGIADKLPDEVRVALASTTSLISDVEITSGIYPTNMRVEPVSFLANAVKLLSGVTSTAGLFDTFHRLQTDTSLFGLDKLPSIPLDLSTPFGVITRQLSASGVITSTAPEVVQLLISAFGDLINGGSFGILPGQVMFGDSSGVLGDMMNRANPITYEQLKDRIESNNLGLGRVVSEATGFSHSADLNGLISKMKSLA